MKRILSTLTLLLCFALTAVNAQVITAERAAEIANSFFSAGMQKSAAARGVVASSSLTTSFDSNDVVDVASAEPTFYVLTNPEGGFVIVSGEETENPIIGYSFDGTINADELSDGFVDYMTDIDAQVKALRQYNANNPQKSAAARSAMARATATETGGTIVVELNTAQWAQGSPYNKYCATTTGATASTGCVPTAYSILCYYHKWPESANEVEVRHSGSNESMTLGHTYDYESMANVSTEAGGNAVATLMRDLGWAYGVSYGVGNTGTGTKGEGPATLMEVFKYKSETPCNHGSYTSNRAILNNDELWIQYIKESLDAGLPIPYSSTTSAAGTARHIYILDGYTNNNYFHFNWGWGGNGNGWFTLNNMVVDTSSDYSNGHKAYFKLMPNKTPRTVTASVSPTGAGTVTVNGSANTAEVIEGTKATLVATANSGYTFSHWSKDGMQVSTEKTYKAAVAAEGNDYIANFYTVGNSINIPVNYDNNMGSVTYNGNIVSATGINPNEYAEVTLTAAAKDGYMFTGWEIVDGTESTKSNDNSITFMAKSGITVNANFALAGGEYKINKDNITPSGTGKCSTWTYSKEGDIEGILTLSTANGSTVVNALGTSNRLYAHAYDNSSNSFREITYTLTAKEGFVITGYSLTYSVSKAGQVTVRNATQTQTPSDYNDYTLTYQYANTARTSEYGTRTAEFVLSSTTDSNTQYITIKDFSVTVLSEGAEGGASTPTTYTISVSATEGGSAYVGTGTSTTVTAGNSVMLTATANNGYTFDGWYNGTTRVSTSLQYTFTPTASGSYQAKFTANAIPEEPSTGTGDLAGKYFRLKDKKTENYMTVENTNYVAGTTSIIVSEDNRGDAQIFYFEQSGNGYKIKQRNGNYLNCDRWSVHANAGHAAVVFTLESTTEELEYLIKWENNNRYDNDSECPDYFKVENSKVYCDAASTAAATWVLEEVVYYTVTATAGEGGRVSPLTSTVEQGKSVTLTATANEGYRFVNWTLNGNVVSTDASYTFNATAAGEYVANFEISTYTISATANPDTAGSVTINGEAVSSKNVNENSTVTLVATPQAGCCFVNWTKGGVEVSTDATYSFTATEITSLVANFEQIVVNATLTDAQSNTYNVQLSGFTNGVTKETVATKLTEKYPYITLGTVENVITLNGSNGAYTYTNTVELPFKVSNATHIWHNIYYPANSNDNPNYIAALNEDEVVDMAASKDYAYGDNPTYNTKDGGNSICWAIYNVNNSFEFIFKSRVTGKYIKVESVSSSTTENVKFVENAEDATAFTLLAKETVDLTGVNPAVTGDCDFALVANVKDATGYLCATSSDKDYVTHFDRYNHRGAWVKIVEAPDYFSKIMDMGTMLGLRFGAGDGKCVIAGTNIEEVNNAMQNSGSITLNNLNKYAARMEVAMATENPTWFNVRTSAENGAAYITLENDDPELTSKRVPGGYELTVKAAPATGYHFTGWTMNGTAIEGATDELRFTVTEATTIVASFAINTYNINVTAGENGSVTVTHDVNGEPVDINGETVDFATVIKIEATPNDGYKFIGWYNGEELQHGINPHEFAINNDINYTARFEKNEAGSTTNKYVIKINATLTDGGTAVNNATGNVQAIIDGIGQDWPTSAEVVENARVELVAISDHNQSGYLFEGWYKNGERVSTALSYKVAVTEKVTYEARFAKGKVIKLTSNNKSLCLPKMPTYTDGSEVAGTITALRAVVRDGEELLISIDDSVIASFTGEGYRVANWTDKDSNEVAGKNVYSFTIKVNGDNTYKVNLEKDTYTLTVSTEGTMGTVHIGDGTETSVTVNNGGTAKITATPNSGYKFVNWTLNGEVVSTENSYNVPAITDNVQYVAVFAEANALDAGYYRIAYDFEVPVETPAKSAATRAAGANTYTINNSTGVLNTAKSSKYIEWVDNSIDDVELSLKATNSDEAPVYAIKKASGDYYYQLNAYTCDANNVYSTQTKYTLSVSNGYIITEYSITYKQSVAGQVTISYDGKSDTFNDTNDHTLSVFPNAQTADFTLSTNVKSANYYYHVKNFTVTLQKVGGETPEPETETVRYYMQSVACGVSGGNNLQNALQMTTDGEDVSSIFYYDGGKLLSYQKGTYVNENGGIRGLQAVGAYEGDKTNIKVVRTNDEDENICTIAAPNYMHAKESNGIYYVDNCGATATCGKDDHNFILEEVTSLPVTISSVGYASFYAPVAVIIPEGIEAYYLLQDNIKGSENNRYASMTKIEGGVIPANTGVILTGKDGKPAITGEEKIFNFDITTIGDDNEEAENIQLFNILDGTAAAQYITEGKAYVLGNKNGIGFYWATTEGQAENTFLNNSHKAYLLASKLSQDAAFSAGFRFVFGGTTAIEKVESRNEKEEIYDLTGRKLEGISGSGIYIINGKKVIIR